MAEGDDHSQARYAGAGDDDVFVGEGEAGWLGVSLGHVWWIRSRSGSVDVDYSGLRDVQRKTMLFAPVLINAVN